MDVEDEALVKSRDLVSPPTAEKDVTGQVDRERIPAILDSMPDTLRLPLMLRHMDQLSYEEVAETLDISLQAVKMRTKRARDCEAVFLRM